jgi:hypothetical protein
MASGGRGDQCYGRAVQAGEQAVHAVQAVQAGNGSRRYSLFILPVEAGEIRAMEEQYRQVSKQYKCMGEAVQSGSRRYR